jgi:hypothetical protein
MTKADKAILGSYARSFLTGAITLYLAGETDPKKLLAAGIAAVLPPLLRWLNPNDKAFGRGSQETNNG